MIKLYNFLQMGSRYLVALVLFFGLIYNIGQAAAISGVNAVLNPSVENANAGVPVNWTSNSWGTNTSSLLYKDGGHTGLKSLYVSMTSRTSGDAKWIPDSATVTSGQSYTYTDYFQSNVGTELDVAYTDAAGNVTYAYLGNVSASSTWQQSSAVFTIPTNAVKASVIHILATPGWLQTDDFSLTDNATQVPPPADTSGNLIANPSFEVASGTSPANWKTGSWGTNNSQFSYSTNSHSGTKSAGVNISSYTSGDAKWYADPVTVTPGKTYTYSDYYQSNVVTTAVAAYTTSTGTTTYVDLPAAAATTTWVKYSASLNIPANTSTVVVFHVLNKVGTLTLDDVGVVISPTITPPPPSSNMISNSSVENIDPAATTNPIDWLPSKWGVNTASFSYLSSGAHTGSRSIKTQITQYTDGDAKWYFKPVAVTQNTQYKFSDYYIATIASEVVVAFNMNDGSTTYQLVGLPEPSSTWTNFSTTFVVPLNARTMSVYHLINRIGSLTIDDANLQTYNPVGFNRAIVSLTFDDGYDTEYSQALPLLTKYGIVSTQFIATGLINTAGYMTPTQLVNFSKAGHEMAAHSVTHTDMLTQTATQYNNELSQSKTQLQNWIGKPVTNFAFPHGLYNQAIITSTKKYYSASRGVENGLNSKDNLNAYDIKVQNIFNTTTAEQITSWIQQAQSTKTWLVLVYHSVNPNTSAGTYNVTPAQLDAHLSALKNSSAVTLTLQQALSEITPQL